PESARPDAARWHGAGARGGGAGGFQEAARTPRPQPDRGARRGREDGGAASRLRRRFRPRLPLRRTPRRERRCGEADGKSRPVDHPIPQDGVISRGDAEFAEKKRASRTTQMNDPPQGEGGILFRENVAKASRRKRTPRTPRLRVPFRAERPPEVRTQ